MMLSLSGPMSKATLDVFFESCKDNAIVTRTLDTLVPKMADLGSHFIGQHVLKKMYDSTTVSNKEKILKALTSGRDQLARCKEGRNTMRITGFDQYIRNEEEWRRNLARQERASAMIAELEDGLDVGGTWRDVDSAKKEKKKGKNSDGNDKPLNRSDEDDNDDACPVGRTKRKRKRNRNKGAGDSCKKKIFN